MRIFVGFYIAVLMVLLSACTDSTKGVDSPQTTSEITIDTSTPDRALKSYWVFIDHQVELSAQYWKDWLKSPVHGKITSWQKRLLTGEILTVFTRQSEIQQFEREILEVKQETESRAVAVARIKNVTPVPEGAKTSDYDREHRERGYKFKYVIEKDKDGWKVSEVYEEDTYRKDWRKYYDASFRVPVLVTP